MTTRILHGGLAAAIVLAAAAAVPVNAMAVPASYAWIATRIGDAPREFTATLDYVAFGDRSAAVAVALRGVGHARRAEWLPGSDYLEAGSELAVQAYHQGPLVPCPAPASCRVVLPEPGGYTWDSHGPVTHDYLFVTNQLEIKKLEIPGWRLQPVSARLTILTGENSSARGLRGLRTSFEHFTSAVFTTRAPSVAVAEIPCGAYGQEGVGAALFTGGTKEALLRCGEDPMTKVYDSSAGGTSWSLRGDVVGVASHVTRLAVLTYSF